MRSLCFVFFGLMLNHNCFAQTLVEIANIDSSGVKRIVKTNRPDTVFKIGKPVPVSSHSSVTEQPIFKSPEDSILLGRIERKIQALMKVPKTDPKMIDSLLSIARDIRSNGIVGYRTVYLANPEFFPFDSLAFVEDYSTIRKLSITKVQSRKIPAAILACQNLEALELVNTSIGRIQKKLRKLPRITSISIYNNQSRNSLKLKKNSKVKSLTIRGTNSSNLPANYSKFTSLVKLDLAYNALTSFPMGISRNKELKELLLSNNAITLEGNIIQPNRHLEKLDLGKNQIKKVPASIGEFTSLKTLKFNYNKISEVHESINRLTKLEQLSFYNNQLPAIPSGVYQLTALKEIDLYYNRIERLEKEISNWQNLEILYLAFNNLYSLPDNLGRLVKLQELYLHNNRLSSLPASISQLQSLKILRINNNFLVLMPSEISQLLVLQNLDLSHNSIMTLEERNIPLTHLKILSVVGNPWYPESKKDLSLFAKKLREQGVIVHLNSFDESID